MRRDGRSRCGVLVLAAVAVVAGLLGSGGAAVAQDVVPPAGVHAGAVTELAELGVFAGTECDDGWCWGEPIARDVAAVWMVRVIDGSDEHARAGAATRFGDVADSAWPGHIERLAELGVTVGCSAEPLLFCPGDTVTRAQMASFLVRGFDIAEAGSAGFSDTSGVHEANIDALYAAGVTVGCAVEPLRFCPRKSTTRAQMASFLNRARNIDTAASDTDQTPDGGSAGQFSTSTDQTPGGGGGQSSGGGGQSSGGGGGQSQTTTTTTTTTTAPPIVVDPRLSSLTVSPGALAPAFASGTREYAVQVGREVEHLTVSYTAVTGVAVSVGAPDADTRTAGHQVVLAAGVPDGAAGITVVTFEATNTGRSFTYTVTVTREAPLSDDTSLSALTLSAGTVTPGVGAAGGLHTASVGAGVRSVTVAATANHANASVEIAPADTDTTTDGRQVQLRSGTNVITVRVTAEDRTTARNHHLTVTRAAASTVADDTLSALSVNVGTAIDFDAGTRWYWVSDVGAAPRQATVAWTAADTNATVTVSPADTNTTTDGHQIALTGPRTQITLTVESADKASTRTYTLSLHRRTEWVNLGAGYDQVCGLRSNGQAACWGNNVFGALPPPGRMLPRWAPAGDVYRDIYIDAGRSCGQLVTGEFKCWIDSGTNGQLTGRVDSDIIALGLDLSDHPVCWLKQRGELRCHNMGVPETVAAGRYTQVDTGLNKIACALGDLAVVTCWDDRNGPPTVLPVPNYRMKHIAVGSGSVCGVELTGELRCWTYAPGGECKGVYDCDPFTYYFMAFQDTTRRYKAAMAFLLSQCGITESGDVRCSSPGGRNRVGNYERLDGGWGGWLCGITSEGGFDCWGNISNTQAMVPNLRADTNIHALNVAGEAITVSGSKDAYSITVASDKATADVVVHPRGASAAVSISPTDSDTTADGHQVGLTTGDNTITITITSEDGSQTKTHTVTVTRPTT